MNLDNIKQLASIKKQIETANKSIKDLKSKKQEVEFLIMQDLTDDGSSLSCTEHGTVSINPRLVPSVKNWAEFEAYIYENRALHLLQRRPSSDAYRDEIKIHGDIPGVETFEVTTLNYSKKST